MMMLLRLQRMLHPNWNFPPFFTLLFSLLLITIFGWPNTHTYGVEGSPVQAPAESIYRASDRVTILTTANFTRFVVDLHADGHKLQLVQFYNSFCGHCISFAPAFKTFLRSVWKWRELLSVSAVDCSIVSNRKICTDYDVEFYPTLRMFWFRPGGLPVEKGDNLHLGGKQEAPDVRHHVLKWITDNWKRGNISSNWPHFPPLTAENKEGLVELLKAKSSTPETEEERGEGKHEKHNQTVLIIVEKDTSFFGREMMMNLSRYSAAGHLRLFRMVESNIRLLEAILPRPLDQFTLPFLIHYSADGQFSVLLKPVMNKQTPGEYFTKLIRDEFLKSVVELDEDAGGVSEIPETFLQKSAIETPKYPSRVYMSDLNNAIRYALFHEVPLRRYLSLDQADALIRFLTVLYENFHFQEEKTRRFVDSAQRYLTRKLNTLKKDAAARASNKASEPIRLEVEDLHESLKMYEDYFHLPEMKPWAAGGCAAAGRRAYPCSLWSLFHVLTVAEYRKSLRQRKQWSSLHASLYAMRDYVKHFFGCTECAEHFAQMAGTLENELTAANASVLWLWEAHNTVNGRLKREPRSPEGSHLPKRQFPTFEECPHCYKAGVEPPPPAKTKTTNVDVDDELGRNASLYRARFYDEKKTLQFLVEFYAVERIVPDKSEYDMKDASVDDSRRVAAPPGAASSQSSHNKDDDEHKTKVHSQKPMLSYVPFTNTDYSIIFIFYVVSVALLLSLCAFFKIRRLRNNRFNKPFSLLP